MDSAGLFGGQSAGAGGGLGLFGGQSAIGAGGGLGLFNSQSASAGGGLFGGAPSASADGSPFATSFSPNIFTEMAVTMTTKGLNATIICKNPINIKFAEEMVELKGVITSSMFNIDADDLAVSQTANSFTVKTKDDKADDEKPVKDGAMNIRIEMKLIIPSIPALNSSPDKKQRTG